MRKKQARTQPNHNAINNSLTGNCSSPAWQNNSETKAFPVYLKKLGYTTFFAGKYLNEVEIVINS